MTRPISRTSETAAAAARFGMGDEDPDAFMQRRVATAALLAWGMGAFFLVLRSLLAVAAGGAQSILRWDLGLHALSVVPLALLWLALRRGARSPRLVSVAEIGTTALTCTLVITLGASMPLLGNPPLIVTLVVGAILMARAIYVPSPPRRTLLLGVTLLVPYALLVRYVGVRWAADALSEARVMLGARGITGEFYAISLAWWLVFVVLSTTTSRVVYGLREKVREVAQLGQYHLEDKLGEGGMGVVFRARHALLQRPTAVKLLQAERVGEESLSRFEREVRQTARLTHPNTVTIYDYGHTPDGVFYYAMELLDGVSLDRVVAGTGPMDPARVVHVLRQVAGSLAEAHAIGLVHRDIKPENIMLCQQGGLLDVVKVLDFGLVKEVERPQSARLTAQDMVLGTPQYMAPEALKSADDVDARADLYALGASAFYLLTGRDVFEADTAVELCAHHLHTPPGRASDHAAVPAQLDELILRCLAKDPGARPSDARALGALLAAFGTPPWTQDDATAWWAAHGTELDRPGGVSTSAPTVRHTS